MLAGIAAILACQLAGEILVLRFDLPIPGPVVGMAVLALILASAHRVPEGLASVADGFLRAMPILFVPAGVGVITLHENLRQAWLPIAGAVIGSTALALAVTAGAMKLALRLRTRGRR